ncbi:hypothetical protein HDV57DRAFT_524251 [Trichoderma longibrachiatum]
MTVTTPYASTKTVIQPQSTQTSAITVVDDADAEDIANVDSVPSIGSKRGTPPSIPATSTKRQNTNHDAIRHMIQSLQSPAIVSAKPKPSTNANTELERRVNVLENQLMTVLKAMTNEIKVLKEKVATLENASD